MCRNENANPEMARYVGNLWPDAAMEKDDVRETLSPRRERSPSRRVTASLSLSLRPQNGSTPLHSVCLNENATPEMARCVGVLCPAAAMEKNKARARPSRRAGRARPRDA